MTRPLLWLGKRLACTALVAIGAALALFAYTGMGIADITHGDSLGKYTYPSTDCHEDDEDAADPINVVFYDEAAADNLDYYFNLYHGWGDNGGETQYFKTWGNCYEMEGQPSSNRGPRDRYHARYHRGLNSGGGVDYDPIWRDYSVAAAHFEDWIIGDGCGLGDHAVPENGFNQGRNNVIDNWVNEPSPGHWFAGLKEWENTLSRLQCNGEWAASDGNVAFIRVYLDNDGDGCTTPQEAAMGFNPDAWYDVIDVPVPALADPTPNGTRNRAVDIGDVLAVLFYVFADDNGPPNANGVDYDSVKGSCLVQGVVSEEGLCYDRTPGDPPTPQGFDPAGPPDGVIDIRDVLIATAQSLAVDCS